MKDLQLKRFKIAATITIKAENSKQAEDYLLDRIFYYGVEDATITSTEEIKDND